MRDLWVTVLIMLFMECTTVRAQEITGSVVDQNQQPIEFVNVVLYGSDADDILSVTTTDSSGHYVMPVDTEQSVLIKASAIGYDDFVSDTLLLSKGSIAVEISLKTSSYVLNEIVIEAKKPKISQRGGKLVVDLSSAVLTGQNISNVLKRVPGVIVRRDAISIGGLSSATIMINGRSSNYLDMRTFLQDFPAENIEKIEIIKQPDATMEASGSGPIVNLILKRNTIKGTNGYISGSIGEDVGPEYSSSLYLYSFQNSLNVEGNIGYRKLSYLENLDIYRTIGQQDYTQLNQSPLGTSSLDGRLAADYYINDHHTIGISFTGQDYKNNYVTSSKIDITENGNNTYRLYTDIETNDNADIIKINPYYQLKWNDKSADVLKVNFRYLDYNTENNFYFKNTPSSSDSGFVNYLIDQDGGAQGYSTVVDLVKQLDKEENSILKLGFRNDIYNVNSFVNNFEEGGGGELIPNPMDDDQFVIDDDITAVYTQFEHSADAFSFGAGLRWEDSSTEGYSVTLDSMTHLDISRFFPSANVTYSLSDNVQLNASYSARIRRPNFAALNPFTINYDPISQDAGNPRLQPEFTNNYSFRILYQDQPAIEVTYLDTDNKIYQSIVQDVSTAEITRQNINIDHSKSVAIQLGIPLSFIPGVDGGGAFVINYQNFENNQADFPVNSDLWSWLASYQISASLPFDISLDNYFYYGNKQFDNALEQDWYTNTGIELGRSFLDDKLQLSFSWDDIIPRKNILRLADGSIDGRIESYNSFGYASLRARYSFGKKAYKTNKKIDLDDSGDERL